MHIPGPQASGLRYDAKIILTNSSSIASNRHTTGKGNITGSEKCQPRARIVFPPIDSGFHFMHLEALKFSSSFKLT
jgi:hypothetical protein